MRQGDFSDAAAVGSGSLVNQVPVFFGTPTPVIPAPFIDPGGRVLLDRYPLPNADPALTGGYNFVENPLVDQPNHQLLARLDDIISEPEAAPPEPAQRIAAPETPRIDAGLLSDEAPPEALPSDRTQDASRRRQRP